MSNLFTSLLSNYLLTQNEQSYRKICEFHILPEHVNQIEEKIQQYLDFSNKSNDFNCLPIIMSLLKLLHIHAIDTCKKIIEVICGNKKLINRISGNVCDNDSYDFIGTKLSISNMVIHRFKLLSSIPMDTIDDTPAEYYVSIYSMVKKYELYEKHMDTFIFCLPQILQHNARFISQLFDEAKKHSMDNLLTILCEHIISYANDNISKCIKNKIGLIDMIYLYKPDKYACIREQIYQKYFACETTCNNDKLSMIHVVYESKDIDHAKVTVPWILNVFKITTDISQICYMSIYDVLRFCFINSKEPAEYIKNMFKNTTCYNHGIYGPFYYCLSVEQREILESHVFIDQKSTNNSRIYSFISVIHNNNLTSKIDELNDMDNFKVCAKHLLIYYNNKETYENRLPSAIYLVKNGMLAFIYREYENSLNDDNSMIHVSIALMKKSLIKGPFDVHCFNPFTYGVFEYIDSLTQVNRKRFIGALNKYKDEICPYQSHVFQYWKNRGCKDTDIF